MSPTMVPMVCMNGIMAELMGSTNVTIHANMFGGIVTAPACTSAPVRQIGNQQKKSVRTIAETLTVVRISSAIFLCLAALLMFGILF